jgi:GNAT superfamily N-acetyltransferase
MEKALPSPLVFEWLEQANNADQEQVNQLLTRHLSSRSPSTSADLMNTALSAGTAIGCLRDPGGVIRGIAVLVRAQDLYGAFGIIEAVVIQPEFRGRGYSRILMTRLIELARACNFVRVQLTSKPKRKEANILYPKLGFELVETNVYRLPLSST